MEPPVLPRYHSPPSCHSRQFPSGLPPVFCRYRGKRAVSSPEDRSRVPGDHSPPLGTRYHHSHARSDIPLPCSTCYHPVTPQATSRSEAKTTHRSPYCHLGIRKVSELRLCTSLLMSPQELTSHTSHS